jgi:hypothetical protein
MSFSCSWAGMTSPCTALASPVRDYGIDGDYIEGISFDENAETVSRNARSAQVRRVVAHVAGQASIKWQFRRREFVRCGDVSDVARGQGKAEQPPLTVRNTMDFGRSAAAGTANRLFARAPSPPAAER